MSHRIPASSYKAIDLSPDLEVGEILSGEFGRSRLKDVPHTFARPASALLSELGFAGLWVPRVCIFPIMHSSSR